MINIKIDGIFYDIPEKWSDVSLDRFITYYQHNFNLISQDISDTEYEDIEFIQIMSILTNIPYEKIMGIDIEHIRLINKSLSFIKNDLPKNTKTKLKVKYKDQDVNLEIKDFSKLTLGEVANIEVLTDKKDPIIKLPDIISVIYNSDNEEFNKLDLNKKSDIIREQVSVEGVIGLPSFFFHSLKILDYHIQTYSIMKKLKGWRKMKVKVKYLLVNITTRWRLVYRSLYYRLMKSSDKVI
jgi:hypothetical protein